jgi:hypothetical protein
MAAALLAGGCQPGSPGRLWSEADAVQRAEQQLAHERALREAAEARLDEQERRTARWQTVAFIAAVVACLALIIGTIIGSRARHDAEK